MAWRTCASTKWPIRHLAITGMDTAAMICSIMSGSLILATPPCARMSAGTRSSAITATAPASSAILAWSGVTTSMITPPLSISAMPRLTRAVPVCALRPAPPGNLWSDVVSGTVRTSLASLVAGLHMLVPGSGCRRAGRGPAAGDFTLAKSRHRERYWSAVCARPECAQHLPRRGHGRTRRSEGEHLALDQELTGPRRGDRNAHDDRCRRVRSARLGIRGTAHRTHGRRALGHRTEHHHQGDASG